MIEVKMCDNKEFTLAGDNVKAEIVGCSIVVSKGSEVFLITPIANIKSLIRVEEE